MNFKRSHVSSLVVFSVLLGRPLFAQTFAAPKVAEFVAPTPVALSSSTSPASPGYFPAPKLTADVADGPVPPHETANKPFSAIGVDVKIGAGGIGFDVATPLARKFNLRGTGYFFRYNTTITENYVSYGGDIQLASGGLSLDWFPFAGSFHVTGGFLAYNGNELTGRGSINPNESFTLNGKTYYSSATDPVHASASLVLGSKAAPSFSVGWGNIVPRKANKHFSVPVELGFAYVGYPHVDLGFNGSTCDALGEACQTVGNNPTFQQDLAAQRTKYRDDLSAFRFYPIVSIGFGYKF